MSDALADKQECGGIVGKTKNKVTELLADLSTLSRTESNENQTP
jgi:hypothetical protein